MSKLFIGFSIVAAVLVIAVVVFTTRQPATSNTSSLTNTNALPDQFQLLVAATQSAEGDIVSYDFGDGNRLNVMPAEYQWLVLNETPVQQSQAITIGDVAAERLTVTSAKDGSPTDVVQLVLDGTLYDFRGSSDFLSQLDTYVQFTN